jgi:hypothetical protein
MWMLSEAARIPWPARALGVPLVAELAPAPPRRAGSTAHPRSGSDVLQAFTTNVITLLKNRGG